VLVITAIGMGADTLDKFTKKSDSSTPAAPAPEEKPSEEA
jgi:hypothetical protein